MHAPVSLQGPAQSLLVATQPPAMHSTLVVPNRLRRSSTEMKEKVKGVGREGVKKWAKESRWKRPGQMKKQSKKATNASPRNCARATHDPASFMMATKLQSRQHASNSSSPVNQYERASHLPFSAPLPHSLSLTSFRYPCSVQPSLFYVLVCPSFASISARGWVECRQR